MIGYAGSGSTERGRLSAVGSLLVLGEVISSTKSVLAALARADVASVDVGSMDFAFMAFKAAFVSECPAIAYYLVADVGTKVLVPMSPVWCEYDLNSCVNKTANYPRAVFVKKG